LAEIFQARHLVRKEIETLFVAKQVLAFFGEAGRVAGVKQNNDLTAASRWSQWPN